MRIEDVANGKDGKLILEILSRLLMGNPTPESLLREGKPIANEIVWEAEMILLVKRNMGASKEKQIKLLKENGYKPSMDRDGDVFVFFGSSIAPECDSYAYWHKIEREYEAVFVDKAKWKEEGF